MTTEREIRPEERPRRRPHRRQPSRDSAGVQRPAGGNATRLSKAIRGTPATQIPAPGRGKASDAPWTAAGDGAAEPTQHAPARTPPAGCATGEDGSRTAESPLAAGGRGPRRWGNDGRSPTLNNPFFPDPRPPRCERREDPRTRACARDPTDTTHSTHRTTSSARPSVIVPEPKSGETRAAAGEERALSPHHGGPADPSTLPRGESGRATQGLHASTVAKETGGRLTTRRETRGSRRGIGTPPRTEACPLDR